MKCPKCGSNNIRTERRPNGFNWCNECGHQWQSGIKSPEPTTAEMLLWLCENENIDFRYADGEHIISVWQYLKQFKLKSKVFEEAIKQAYDWVKQEEKC